MSKGEFNGVEFGTGDATRARGLIREYGAFDCAAAVHWYASDFHNGQWSDLYALLSASEYRPGPMENGPRDAACCVYSELAHGQEVGLAAAILAAIADGGGSDG